MCVCVCVCVCVSTGDFEYMPALKAAVERVVALDALTDEASAAQVREKERERRGRARA